jgi:hypothetical protein
MGQVSQAFTRYGAISVYGPQIFELLGFRVTTAEYITLSKYLLYLGMVTLTWMLIDHYGRRWLMVRGAFWLASEQYHSAITLCAIVANHTA